MKKVQMGAPKTKTHFWLKTKFFVLTVSMIIAAAPAAIAGGALPDPIVLGYLPSYRDINAVLGKIEPRSYTHIALSFANPDAQGAVAKDGAMTCMLDGNDKPVSVVDLKRSVETNRANGTKTLISIGGGEVPNCSGDWAKLIGEDQGTKMAETLSSFTEELQLDGVDIDLEGELLTAIDKAGNYEPFIKKLSINLRKNQYAKLLTVATASYDGGMIPVSTIPYFDIIGIMSYDNIGPSWGKPGDEHSPYDVAVADVDLWLSRGAPAEKLVLGVPFYGYGFGSLAAEYSVAEIVKKYGIGALDSDVQGERCPKCDYITYNGTTTLTKKANLAGSKLGGIMVWEISQDLDDHQLSKLVRANVSGP
jgi:chitinase